MIVNLGDVVQGIGFLRLQIEAFGNRDTLAKELLGLLSQGFDICFRYLTVASLTIECGLVSVRAPKLDISF